jgi:choline dehydrogenase-like flavoprotein
VAVALIARERAVLAAVCDTLIPTLARDPDPGGYFAAGALAAGTPARVEGILAELASDEDRKRLRLLLRVLDSRAANLASGAGFASFRHLSPERREALLRAWAFSRLPLRRAGFQALKRLVQVAYFCWPTANGRHPAWTATGYPGPLPPPAGGCDALPALAVDRDTTLDCDVVVVGSGAGGGVVAGVLGEAGRDVVVLEKGGNPSSRDFSQIEGDMFHELYLDHGMVMTHSGSMPILAGSCVGGGTVINWTTSFPLPEPLRAEWDRRSGLTLFTSAGFQQSLDRVRDRLHVGIDWTAPGPRDVAFERGLRALGWPVAAIPRNVTDCREGLECGYCGYGCRHGAKNSTSRTYLADAVASGARLVSHCEVERILVERGRATGVMARALGADGRSRTVMVRARVVVVACGALHTPALLARSGLSHPQLGQHLHLHPVSAVGAFFPERIEPWSGALQTRYSTRLADLDGKGYGARFETGPIHFALPASAFGWESARAMREDVGRLAHMGHVGILLRDRDAGRVTVDRDGRPRARYEVSRYDAAHMRQAIEAGARIMGAAGAAEIFTLQTPPARVRPGRTGWLDDFMARADATGYRRFRMSYVSFHQMGTAAMGADRERGVVGETGQSFDVRGLFVADASAFPAPSGVNPMITIMAIADHVAHGIAGAP